MAIKIDPEKLVAVDALRDTARGLWDAASDARQRAQEADAAAQEELDEAIGLTGHVLSFTRRIVGYVKGGQTQSRRLLVRRVRLIRDGLQAEGKSVSKSGEVGTMTLECLLDDADDLGTLEQFKGAK